MLRDHVLLFIFAILDVWDGAGSLGEGVWRDHALLLSLLLNKGEMRLGVWRKGRCD